jgi:hypothetical protein
MIRHLLSVTITAMLFAACLTGLKAQDTSHPNFPLPLGPTNTGKEFWLSFPTNWNVPQATTQYIRLYITSNVRTRVDVSEGASLLQTVYTVPFDIVTVDIAPSSAEAVVRDDQSPVPPDQVYTKRAIHVAARDPIIVYGLNRTSFTTDGLLALPTNALGREYVVASAADIADGTLQKLPSQFIIIAPHDGTIVRITNPMSSPNHGADSTFTITMDKGDVFSSMSSGASGDLSGAHIRSNKPIAVTAGQNCTYLPDSRYCCCDHLEEMLLPISSWGKLYHSVPFAERIKGDMYRIFAGEDSARIYINGVLYATLNKVGGINGEGWVEYLPAQRGLVEISSDKRISVAQYNNSQRYDNTQTDPFYVVLTPVEQYQKQIVFTTPSQDYPKNYLNLVCDSASYYDLEIAVGDTGAWQKVSAKYPGTPKVFPSQFNGKKYVGATLEISPMTYRLRGSSRFAAYIYGSSSYDSYGYPVSALVADRATNDAAPAEVAMTSQDSLGTVNATVTEEPADSAGRSNISTIDLDPTASRNYSLAVDPFEPGVAASSSFVLTVLDRSRDADAVVVITDMAGNVTLDTVHYKAPATSAVPRQAETASAGVLEIRSTNPLTGNKLELAYRVDERSTVTLALFDASGHAVMTPIDGRSIDAGRHFIELPVQQLAAGVYFVRLTIDDRSTNQQIVIAR